MQPQREFEKAVFDNMVDMIVACDAAGRITLLNRAMEDFLGTPATPLAPESWAELRQIYHVDGTPTALDDSPLTRALRGERVRGMELVVAPRSGSRRTVVANGQSFHDADGRLMGAVVVMHDITDQRDAESGLAFQALHDAVTGLPNRALFVDRVNRTLQRAGRHRRSTALLAVNIDQFRVINDRLGHDAGDQLLAEVARRLESALRPYDSVARRLDTVTRLGGDEFFLLCEHVANEGAANRLPERGAAKLAPPIVLGGEAIHISASIGITLTRDPVHDPDGLIIEAETAMRRAKEREPGHHELFAEEMRARLAKRMEGEAALRRALENDEFRVVYQPKILLSTDRVVGMEALVRWEHPEKGVVPPLDFIPLAEETGLILPAAPGSSSRPARKRSGGMPRLLIARR